MMTKDIILGIQFNLFNKRIRTFLIKFCWLFIYSKIARRLYRNELMHNKYECIEYDKKKIEKYNKIITEKIANGYAICVLPAGVGDSALFYMYKKSIEKFHNIKIFSVIVVSRSIIPKLCNETEYLAVDRIEDILDLRITHELYPSARELRDIGCLVPKISAKNIFIAHTTFIPTEKKAFHYTGIENQFIEYTKFLFDIPLKSKQVDVIDISKLNIKKDSSDKPIILLNPDANNSQANISGKNYVYDYVWCRIAKYYKEKGYRVIYNVYSENKRIKSLEEYAEYLNCDLEIALKLAYSAKKVIAMRSGFCDIVYKKGENLFVIYPYEDYKNKFSLNAMFNRNDINEFVLKEENKEEIINQICN